jgi:hypothetical protein
VLLLGPPRGGAIGHISADLGLWNDDNEATALAVEELAAPLLGMPIGIRTTPGAGVHPV